MKTRLYIMNLTKKYKRGKFLNYIKILSNKIKEKNISSYVIVLDNYLSHKTNLLIKYYCDNKINILFNIPYLSKFNSVELCFRNFKKIGN